MFFLDSETCVNRRLNYCHDTSRDMASSEQGVGNSDILETKIPPKDEELAKKFRGCLVGGLIGDCVGEKFEHAEFPVKLSQKKVADYIETLRNSQGKAVLPYTDDTAMAKVLAESLIENKCVNVVDLAKRFTKEYFDCPERNYGLNVVDVFDKLRKDCSDALQPAQQQFNGTGSYGNGAAMRIGPIALLYFAKRDQLIKAAREQSLVTHSHHNGYNGAVLLALAIQEALSIPASDSFDKLEFLKKLSIQMSEIEAQIKRPQDRTYCIQLDKMRILLEKPELPSIDEVVSELGNNVTAPKSVPIAIYSFLVAQNPFTGFAASNTFERIVQYAISMGGDTDTIGCMAGYIAGAHLGIANIPSYLQVRCEDCDKIIQLADDLYKIAEN